MAEDTGIPAWDLTGRSTERPDHDVGERFEALRASVVAATRDRGGRIGAAPPIGG